MNNQNECFVFLNDVLLSWIMCFVWPSSNNPHTRPNGPLHDFLCHGIANRRRWQEDAHLYFSSPRAPISLCFYIKANRNVWKWDEKRLTRGEKKRFSVWLHPPDERPAEHYFGNLHGMRGLFLHNLLAYRLFFISLSVCTSGRCGPRGRGSILCVKFGATWTAKCFSRQSLGV